MGGIASAIGGLGAAAQHFGDQQRLLNLQQWATTQKQMMEGYDDAIKQLGPMSSPELMASLHQGRAGLAKVQPGDHKATAKAVQDFQNLLQVHPNTVAALAPPGPPKPQPGPAAPGETPGTGTLSNMIANPGAAAAPASSPVQPSRQSAPGPSGGLEQPLGAPSASAPAAAAPETPSILPVGQPQASSSNPLVDRFMMPGLQPPSLATAAQPFMSNQAELERQKQLIDLRTGVLQRSGVMTNPNIPDYMKAILPLSAAGVQMPYGLMGLMGQHQEPIDVTGYNAEQKAMLGLPPEATGPQLVNVDRLGNLGHAIGPKYVSPIETQTPGGVQLSSRVTGAPVAPLQGAVPPAMNAPKTAATAAGGVEQYTPAQVSAGQQPTQVPGAVSPAMLPTVGEHVMPITTVGPDGLPVTHLETVQTSSQKVAPGRAGAPLTGAPTGPTPTHFNGVPLAHSRDFEKPLSAEQQVHSSQQLKQYNIAVDRMGSIRQQLPLLNSLIESGKLTLELDTSGLLKALVNRALPMTEAESKFVGNFRTMMEDINLLRGPMGATGFRGPEAWAALQAQRGQLLANPAITAQVMDNSIASLRGQQVPLAKKLKQKVHFSDGSQGWDIPADMVDDFTRDHPNAR